MNINEVDTNYTRLYRRGHLHSLFSIEGPRNNFLDYGSLKFIDGIILREHFLIDMHVS